jgi:putative transcriptional regulator
VIYFLRYNPNEFWMLALYAKASRENIPGHILRRLKEEFKKLTGRALAEFGAKRDVWQEVLDGVREIKAGRGRRFKREPRSPVLKGRLRAGLTQAQFAALLGVSRRTLEQWEQGRREPSGAAKTLIKVAELHPEILRRIPA